ncbi:MAG: tetratricopeptide repeat protein [Butyrivibrio sp.]|nr:tetratricopeptide repeat protein [Butyrivibrio sp.]
MTGNRRQLTRAEIRAKKRRTKVFIARLELGLVVFGLFGSVIGGVILYNQLPGVKASKAVAAGNEYKESAEYQQAIESYENAIEIDASNLEAYSNMAGAYLSLEDTESAKTVLYSGWENTQSEALLNNYYAVVLNEAVKKINAGEGDMETVASMINVLSMDPDNADALELVSSAYSYAFGSTDDSGNNLTFWESDDAFDTYDKAMVSLMDTYEENPSDELSAIITKYLVPASDSVYFKYEDAAEYTLLLERAASLGLSTAESDSLEACFGDASGVLSVFEGIFSEVDSGNIEALREFVVSEDYITLRDAFLNNEETILQNTTYVPVSREGLVLERTDGTWTYRFMSFDENPSTQGVLTLWANFLEDDGIQRNAISYEPAGDDSGYYPHTNYTVTYLYSNVTINGTLTPKMNYRLSTEIFTSESESEETIVVDWGGDNESTMDTETIGKKMTP